MVMHVRPQLRSALRRTQPSIVTQFNRLSSAVKRALSSKWFFRGSLLWIAGNAAWIAFSGLYPMAFDEAYHYGLIQLYSNKLTPFWNAMPEGGSVFGALTRDPSYLFHYLLSFPFRIIEVTFGTLESRVIALRLMCIGFFVAGVYLYRKVLLRAGLSPALAHLVLLLFGALPIVPLLAGQINYDNLLFLLMPACLLYLQNIHLSLQQSKTLPVAAVLKLALLSMTASLVKFSFLPVIASICVIVVGLYFYYVRDPWKERWQSLQQQFFSVGRGSRVILITACVVLLGLCFERYGLNTLRYGTPAPDCDAVLTRQECRDFSPWRRNDNTRRSFEAGELTIADPTLSTYVTKTWFPTSFMHLFYALNGPASGYSLGAANTNLLRLALGGLLVGTLLVILGYYWIRQRFKLGQFMLIAVAYGAVLLQRNYSEFLYLGYPFGIQGRYLVPFLPVIMAVYATGYQFWLTKLPNTKTILTVVAIAIVLTQGGGAATFILRSDSSWYRSSRFVETANHRARSILTPVLLKEPVSPLP